MFCYINIFCYHIKYLPTKQQQNTNEYNEMNIIRTSIRSNTKSLFDSSASRVDLLINTSSSTPDIFIGVMNVVLFHIPDMVVSLLLYLWCVFFLFHVSLFLLLSLVRSFTYMLFLSRSICTISVFLSFIVFHVSDAESFVISLQAWIG